MISLNILLDRILDFPLEPHIFLPSEQKYRGVKFYKESEKNLSDDLLYVALLSSADGIVSGLEKRTVSFIESFSHILLGSLPANRNVWKGSVFYGTLKMLYEYDIKHSMNNLQMLFVYLNCESRPAEAGNVLHMSRNNVAYRIDRIEQMIGMNLKDPVVRTGLINSYIMLQLYGFD